MSADQDQEMSSPVEDTNQDMEIDNPLENRRNLPYYGT